MKNKIVLLLLCLTLTGCVRFAIITKRTCNHENTYKEEWGGFFQWRWFNWWALGWKPRLNPLHWHNGAHTKCQRCGQKFCEYWSREKWLNKVTSK